MQFGTMFLVFLAIVGYINPIMFLRTCDVDCFYHTGIWPTPFLVYKRMSFGCSEGCSKMILVDTCCLQVPQLRVQILKWKLKRYEATQKFCSLVIGE